MNWHNSITASKIVVLTADSLRQLPKNLAINMDSPTMEAANPLKN